jgi:hypothetical protein
MNRLQNGGRGIDPARLRSVHTIAKNQDLKALYYDPECAALRPNLVFVEPDGSGGFEINEVGLKGDSLDPRRKLAVIWGDSVVFSAGRGWPCLIDRLAPGWQFLNGGLDGDPYINVLRRAGEFNRRHSVALNLLMLGWHPFVPILSAPSARRQRWSPLGKPRQSEAPALRPGNENIRTDLTRFLETYRNTVVLTMPTALNPRIIDWDLSAYLVPGDAETGFRFLGNEPYRIEGQRQGFEHILERNAITREVCAGLGVRVIDLFAIFDTEELTDFREHFYDLIHFRERSHPVVAEAVYDGIKDLLG